MAQCRKCEECLAARKRHWVGRLLAEEQTCDSVWFATLTYGGGTDNAKAKWLEYSDVQKMFKSMRKAGFKFKYVAVGEYGGKNSRAHWHVLFFWEGDPPQFEMDKRINDPIWPHGFSQWEYPRSKVGAAVYIMDYLDKDNLSKNLLKYSKRPMLGGEYLLEYARRQARAGLALFPERDCYTVPGAIRQNGQPFYYPVGRKTAIYEQMLDAYVKTWVETRPEQRFALSDDLVSWLENLLNDDYAPERTYDFDMFMDRHYETGVADWHKEYVQTVHAFKGFRITTHPTFSTLTVLDNYGDGSWHADLGKSANPRVLDQTTWESAKAALQKVPPRLQKLLQIHSPGLLRPETTKNVNRPPKSQSSGQIIRLSSTKQTIQNASQKKRAKPERLDATTTHRAS